jgi:nucleoside-diphosphate-sugar epimerase
MGTILLTGANGSLAIPAVNYLLSKYPTYMAVLTVRDTTDRDRNTAKLRKIIEAFPSARVSIRRLDLASLSAVQNFATDLHHDVASGKLPQITAIVCNAFA